MATYADGRKEYRLSDKVGNLYNDPDRKLRKYLEGGRIEKSGEWTFKYDKDGQLIEKFRGNAGIFSAKKDRWEYRWTQNGMLEGVRSPHRYGQWTCFTYDALGRRLTKLGDATFHYLWNGNVPLHEWQTGNRYVGSVLTPYSEDFKTWLFEEESFVPLALIQEGKAYSIVCDQLGTPTEAYDEEGKEVWYRRLDMNGKILEETQPGLNPEGYVSIPFLFQGQYYDHETGLAYNRFRYYDPELGRYISQDPIGFESGTIALHNYVENPNDSVDFFGLQIYRKKDGRFGKKPGRKSSKDRKRELEQRRRKGVKLAWEMEYRLVKESGAGTRKWSDGEIRELMNSGKVRGYVGHHINSVQDHPGLADNPNNIKFLTHREHLDVHGGNFHNATKGNLINR